MDRRQINHTASELRIRAPESSGLNGVVWQCSGRGVYIYSVLCETTGALSRTTTVITSWSRFLYLSVPRRLSTFAFEK